MKQYTYQMTKEEIRELSLWMTIEQMKLRNWIVIAFLTMSVITQCVVWPVPVMIPLLTVVLLFFMIFGLLNYSDGKDRFWGKKLILRAQDGMLKLEREGEPWSEAFCADAVTVITTRRLIMIRCRKAFWKSEWYFVPRRIFADRQEQDSFKKYIRNGQNEDREKTAGTGSESREESLAENLGMPEAGESVSAAREDDGTAYTEQYGQVYFNLTFPMGEEEWVRMQMDLQGMAASGIPGSRRWSSLIGGLIWTVFAVVYSIFLYRMVWHNPNADGTGTWLMIVLGVILFSLPSTWWESPEEIMRESYRKKRGRDYVAGECGVMVTEAGVRINLPKREEAFWPWDNRGLLVETEDNLFFIERTSNQYMAIPLKEIGQEGKLESLKELCREKEWDIFRGKQRKYLPRRGKSLWIFFVVLAGVCLYVWLGFRGH